MRIFVTCVAVDAIKLTTMADLPDHVYIGGYFTITGYGTSGQLLTWDQTTGPLPEVGTYVDRDVKLRVVESTHDEWTVA